MQVKVFIQIFKKNYFKTKNHDDFSDILLFSLHTNKQFLKHIIRYKCGLFHGLDHGGIYGAAQGGEND